LAENYPKMQEHTYHSNQPSVDNKGKA